MFVQLLLATVKFVAQARDIGIEIVGDGGGEGGDQVARIGDVPPSTSLRTVSTASNGRRVTE